MLTLTAFGSSTAAIFVTCPILTPLNSTGEPIDKPVMEPEKNITHVKRFWKNLPEPNTVMPSTASARAPTTNPPISVLLGCLAMARVSTPGEEREHAGIRRLLQQLLRVARRDRRPGLAVEQHRVVADGEDARQLVSHHHD